MAVAADTIALLPLASPPLPGRVTSAALPRWTEARPARPRARASCLRCAGIGSERGGRCRSAGVVRAPRGRPDGAPLLKELGQLC